MTEPIVVSQLVGVAYRHFVLRPIDVEPEFEFTTAPAPLLYLDEDEISLALTTGIENGLVHLSIEVLVSEPVAPEPVWEAVQECSLARLEQLYYESPGVEHGLYEPLVTPGGPGVHRVRASARRRERSGDATPGQFEQYLVQIWPETDGRDSVVLRDDGLGLSV